MNLSNFVLGVCAGVALGYAGITLGSRSEFSAGLVAQTANPPVLPQPVQSGPSNASGAAAKIVDGKVNDLAVFMVEYIAKSANQSGTEQIVKLVAEQKAYVDLLDSRGLIFLAGMFLNDGNRTFLFASKTEEDARKIVNESPFAKSGYYNLRLRQLSVTHAGVVTSKPGPRPIEITATPDSSQLETP